MDEILAMIRAFCGEFTNTNLYDTGFGYNMAETGCLSAETREDMRVALAFLNGTAQMARLANTYQSAQWLICNDMASLAGQLCSMLDTQENIPLPSAASFQRVLNSTRDLLREHLLLKAG